MIARRPSTQGKDPFETPIWFVVLMVIGTIASIGMIGVVIWALIEVVQWLTSK
jgi:hypothetical protein